jgi:hypothetical protein
LVHADQSHPLNLIAIGGKHHGIGIRCCATASSRSWKMSMSLEKRGPSCSQFLQFVDAASVMHGFPTTNNTDHT